MHERCDSHSIPLYAMRQNSTNLDNLKNVIGVSSMVPTACVDCTEPIFPSREITSQCTDQCIVIACNDPDHGEMSCRGSTSNLQCDLVCDGGTNCVDCSGFDDFLQCCTDYHSYFSEPRDPDPEHGTPFSWDSTLNDFLCACGVQGQVLEGSYPTMEGPNSKTDSSFMVDANHSHFSTELQLAPPTTQQLQPKAPASMDTFNSLPVAIEQTVPLACMWGSCSAQFTSLSDLVGHVNLEHLRLPSSPIALPPVTPTINPDHPTSCHLSCLWRDCDVYPSQESIPSSSGDHVDEVLNILANHLLQDHLGLTSRNHANSESEGEVPSITFSTDASSCSTSGSPSPIHECSSTHKCHWEACGCTFMTCDDLTSHITAVHVGAGKAQYECFWEGCNRNGTRGFSSKQKICRHLQSHTGHRPFQCTICQQNFSEAATLQQHMRRHTQEKPYKCDYPGCGKSFAITGALTIHKRIHNGYKPFKCKFCDRAFAESSNLSKHLRTHTGARPYSCTEPGCNKAFARPDQLTRHIGVHKKKGPSAETLDDT